MSSRHNLQALLFAGLLLGGGAPLLQAQLGVGDQLPDWTGQALEGQLPDVRDRVLLVDFWASWCDSCQASFPGLARIHQAYAARGVTLVAISVDRNPRAYETFLKKQAPPFATVRDARQEYVALVRVETMPTSFVVGRDRRIRAVFSGYHGEKTSEAIHAALDAALADTLTK